MGNKSSLKGDSRAVSVLRPRRHQTAEWLPCRTSSPQRERSFNSTLSEKRLTKQAIVQKKSRNSKVERLESMYGPMRSEN